LEKDKINVNGKDIEINISNLKKYKFYKHSTIIAYRKVKAVRTDVERHGWKSRRM
jgi:hypothetical protein